MLGSRDKAQFIKIWNKMQDHIDVEKVNQLRNRKGLPYDVIKVMQQGSIRGENVADKILKLQNEVSL